MMKRLCDFYIRHPRLIGACYCILPVVVWYGVMFAVIPFRSVYVFRLLLSLIAGGLISAYVNEFGLRLWLIKHRSVEGPATVPDGFLIGAGIGVAVVLVPTLASLIATHHPEEARMVIIGCWVAGVLVGGMIGSILAKIGRQYVSRAPSDGVKTA